MIRIPIKRLTETAILPTRAHEYDAGFDLYVDIEFPITIRPHETMKIPTGVGIAVPPGWEAQIRTRSGMAAKHDLCLLNAPGTVDCGYINDVSLLVHNAGSTPYTINPGERLGQMVIKQIPQVELTEVEELPQYGTRGMAGFGSTGR